MRPEFRVGFWVGLFLLGSTTTLLAQGTAGRPEFSADERAIIVRNQALTVAMTVDPGVVRQILDEMARPSPRGEGKGIRRPRSALEGKEAPAGEIDSARNPDLELYMQRASPEAAYDLMQILKRVGAVGLGPKR